MQSWWLDAAGPAFDKSPDSELSMRKPARAMRAGSIASLRGALLG